MTPEPWMTPFLRANISESKSLVEYKNEVRDNLFNIETMVQSYLQNAML
jgi:hypothetical protein